jgi:hypothetical protein
MKEWTVAINIKATADCDFLFICEPTIHYHLASLRPITALRGDVLAATFRVKAASQASADRYVDERLQPLLQALKPLGPTAAQCRV